MAEGYIDEQGRVRWAEEHEFDECGMPRADDEREPGGADDRETNAEQSDE